jgi:hypothetical protein
LTRIFNDEYGQFSNVVSTVPADRARATTETTLIEGHCMVMQRGYPVRYSLAPDERRTVAQTLKQRGGATPTQIKGIARSKGVAQKTIVQLIESLGLKVLPDTAVPSAPRGKDRARAEAEKLFRAPEPAPLPADIDVTEPEFDMKLSELLDLETELRRKNDESLEYLATVETQLAEARAEAEAERERARAALEQTKKLRIATRADRERIDELEGEMNVLKRKYNRLAGKARWLYGELTGSTDRERKLLAALDESERAYESLKARCKG